MKSLDQELTFVTLGSVGFAPFNVCWGCLGAPPRQMALLLVLPGAVVLQLCLAGATGQRAWPGTSRRVGLVPRIAKNTGADTPEGLLWCLCFAGGCLVHCLANAYGNSHFQLLGKKFT